MSEILVTYWGQNDTPVNLDDVDVTFFCNDKDITPKDLKVEGNTIEWNLDNLTDQAK